MNSKVLLMILLAGLSVQQCTIGCLKCNSANQCLVCDSTANYYLNGNTCTLSTLTNCNLLSQAGACVQCNSNFYLDVNSQKCLAITTSAQIANCANYNSGQVCVACSGNFFLNGGVCSAVNSTIANCQVYNSAQLCVQCASGYVVNTLNSACVALPSGANCLYYTYIGCRACASGFVINPNLYFTAYTPAGIAASLISNSVARPFDWVGLGVCQAVTVLNCLTYSAFNFCTNCASGYYLQNGNCIAFPLPIIFACQTYSSLVTCSACQAGYYLSSNTCLVNTVIANCLTYDGTASSTSCLACVNGYFLQGNQCANRTSSANIANCQTVSINADTCATCATGFILTSDARACLAAISNCQTYATGSSFQSSTLQCSLCSNGFYLTSSGSTTVCVAGTVQFCLTYQANSNVCTACNNGYYLNNGGQCIQHVNIANCATYDPTKANFCAVCAAGFYNFAYTTVCVATNVISNCASYSADGNSCAKCNSGFYVNGGSCTAIPSTYANCATYSGQQCTLCNAGYMVNTLPTVGTCTLQLDYINSTTNSPCAVAQSYVSTLIPTWTGSVSNTQTLLTCGTCNNYMYGYNPLQAEAICVLSTQLNLYSGYTAVNNCLRYGLNYAASPAIVCMQCSSGYYISGYDTSGELSTATSCTSTCTIATSSSPSIIPDDGLGFANICLPAPSGTTNFLLGSGTCARYGRSALAKVGVVNQVINLAAANGAKVSGDYWCWSVMAGSGTYAANYFVYDGAVATLAANKYLYESPSASTQQSVVVSGPMYSNTVDQNSVFPNVFNYLGILHSPIYTNQIIRPNAYLGTAEATTQSATTVAKNNLSNCDIIALGVMANGGTSFDTTLNGHAGDDTNARFWCHRCAMGYQNVFTGGLTKANTPDFPSCTTNSLCSSSSTVLGGLPPHLNSVLSCHVCAQSNGAATYPYIWVETSVLSGNIVGYQASNAIVSITAPSTTSVVRATSGNICSAAPSVVATVDGAAMTTAAISNCAAYANIAVITTNPTNAPAAAAFNAAVDACIACASNYFPTYLGANGVSATYKFPMWAVTACTASANCDSSAIGQFNFCGRCRTDQDNLLTPTYYAYIDLTLSNCYTVSTRNCLIISSTSFSTAAGASNTCLICKAGYILNADNVCENYKVPNQSASNSGFFKAYLSTVAYVSGTASTANNYAAIRYHYLLSYKQLQYGVSSCNSGYTFAPANTWAPRVCVWSSYVYNNTGNFPSGTKFVNNCVRYNVTLSGSNNLCGGCTTGFIPTIDGTACVNAASIGNCMYAQNGANNGLCYQCNANFFNINGICLATTIPNCATYVNTQWSFTTPGVLQCATCGNGFVLSADSLSCSLGLVANCIQYNQAQPLQCSACAANYVLMTLNTVWYCYPIPASLNCALLQDTSSTSGANYGTISCANCNANSNNVYGIRQWTALARTNEPQTLCMPFSAIANCLTYSQSNSVIKQNTFGCTQCASGFWYAAANNSCVARVNLPAQCTSFSLTSDVCTACASGSFLSLDGTNCINFPNGIFQCRLYTAASTCTQCNAGYYLSNNACIQSTLINNCFTYSANYTCSACNSGFFLQNSTSCITATATNCLTYTSATVCATCASNFGLQTSNGVTSCVAINVANCVNATTVAPFTCLTCIQGFFPNANGVCTTVSQTIANCLIYDTATTCSRCSANSVLNVARTICNTTGFSAYVDPNCAQNYLLSQPVCAVCSAGTFFSNGTCNSCNNNTYSSGCQNCDPVNNNVCLFCRSGYYMNAAGACIANNPTPTPNPNPTPNNTGSAKAIGFTVALSLAAVYYDL